MNRCWELCVVMILVVLLQDGFSQKLRRIPQKYTSHPNWKLLNVLDVCGRPARTFVKKIVGGEDAKLGQFPWMAFLMDSWGKVNCGGSIINNRYILTAAHCESDIYGVILGEYEHKDEGVQTADCVGNVCAPLAQFYNLEDIKCHSFTTQKMFDDICLIRLDRDIQFNDFVKPVCLPFYTYLQDKHFEGEYMEVAGWGKVNKTVEYPSTLQVIQLPVVNRRSCADSWEDYITVVNTQMCTEFDSDIKKDSCDRDSGGPLMKRLNLGRGSVYFQFGIVSFGDPRCEDLDAFKEIPFKPSVYTKVVSYLEWILDHIHE